VDETKERGVVDPGHGGPDPGAVDPIEQWDGDMIATKEEDITLDIGLRVAELLRPVFQVDMTRTDDTALADWRADLVRRARMGDGAAWFVSIHLNSSDKPQAHGTETYYPTGSQEGKALAEAIQRRLVATLGRYDRKVKEADFAVLQTGAKAAALVEVCFMSNSQEEGLINQPEVREKVARAIAQGICDYARIVGVRIIARRDVLYGENINDRAYAPVRKLAEALGQEVEWDANTNTVVVK